MRPPFIKSPNLMQDLSSEKKEEFFNELRQCEMTDEAEQERIALPGITQKQIDKFFNKYADIYWTKRVERAATEANAVMKLMRKNPVEFSEGVLAVLGQEVFRQVASGKVEPGVLMQFTQLFVRKRAGDQAERALVARLAKQKQDMRSKMELALDSFVAEIGKNPEARKAFDLLKTELLGDLDKWELA